MEFITHDFVGETRRAMIAFVIGGVCVVIGEDFVASEQRSVKEIWFLFCGLL